MRDFKGRELNRGDEVWVCQYGHPMRMFFSYSGEGMKSGNFCMSRSNSLSGYCEDGVTYYAIPGDLVGRDPREALQSQVAFYENEIGKLDLQLARPDGE